MNNFRELKRVSAMDTTEVLAQIRKNTIEQLSSLLTPPDVELVKQLLQAGGDFATVLPIRPLGKEPPEQLLIECVSGLVRVLRK